MCVTKHDVVCVMELDLVYVTGHDLLCVRGRRYLGTQFTKGCHGELRRWQGQADALSDHTSSHRRPVAVRP